MRSFDCDGREKSKKFEEKAEMRKRRLFLNFDRHFSSTESSLSNEGVLSKNVLKDTPPKKSFRNKRAESAAEKVKIINLHHPKVALSRRRDPGRQG